MVSRTAGAKGLYYVRVAATGRQTGSLLYVGWPIEGPRCTRLRF
jgi:hypothetical protein